MSNDENIIKMTGTNNTGKDGQQYPSTPKPEYIVETFSRLVKVDPNKDDSTKKR